MNFKLIFLFSVLMYISCTGNSLILKKKLAFDKCTWTFCKKHLLLQQGQSDILVPVFRLMFD